MHLLNDITQLGAISTVIVLCVVLAVAETIRERSVWVTAFIVAVMGGEEILTTTVKQLADRVRPTFNPAGDARAVVPQRPLGDGRRLLCHSRAVTRPLADAPDTSRADRARSWDRRRRRRHSGPPRRSLAVGRGRRPRARLGLVRGLRNRVRRAATPLRRCRRDGCPGRS